MIDGKYNVVMQTPMGTMKGEVVLKTSGNSLSGFIKGMGVSSSFNNGTINNNEIKASGIIKTLFLSLNYTVTGRVDGKTLDLIANTNKGTFKIKGNKVG